MQEKPNYYAIIPAEVRYDNRLKDKSKLLYGEITCLTQKDGKCYATNNYFSQLYGISKTTVSLLVKELVDFGYIESKIIYKGGTKEILNRYLSIVKDPYLRNLKYPIKENLKDNNININNTSINNKEIYKEIIDYLNQKLNSNYKYTTKATQEKINARVREGFTIDDFKKVIDKKYNEWFNNAQMEQYLTPDTLFGTKFEKYLNQKTTQERQEEVYRRFLEKED